MMRFFWMTFLPLSAAGGAAALLLWLARPALRRFAHIQWSVPVLTAALCLFVLPLPVCDARRVECSRAGGAKLCGDGSACRGGCIGTAVRYDGTAHGGGQAASRCAAGTYIHAVGAGPGVLAGRSIVCDAGFVGGIQAFHTSSGA